MKKLSCIVFSLLLIALLAACGKTTTPTPSQTPESMPTPSPETAEPLSNSIGNLEDIKVTYETDNALNQAIVTVKNGGPYTFTGDIHVYFYDSNNKQVGYDMIIIENLKADNSTYARINLSKTPVASFNYRYAQGYSFTEEAPASEGTLDEELSAELAETMNKNFGNAYGNPTSWYKYIDKIEVYNGAGYNYAIIVVNSTDTEIVDRIGNIIIGNYSQKYNQHFNLSRVIVQDSSGTVLFEKAA